VRFSSSYLAYQLIPFQVKTLHKDLKPANSMNVYFNRWLVHVDINLQF
jgi:hypothetical protein